MMFVRFTYRVNVKSQFEKRLVVKVVTPIETKSGFFHGCIDTFKIQILILLPFGQESNRVGSFSRFKRIGFEGNLPLNLGQIDTSVV